MVCIVIADCEVYTNIELLTKDLKRAVDKRVEVLNKECTFKIEVWDNEIKIGDVFWDDDFEVFGGTSTIIEMIRRL